MVFIVGRIRHPIVDDLGESGDRPEEGEVRLVGLEIRLPVAAKLHYLLL
jgi:hypothetical protein